MFDHDALKFAAVRWLIYIGLFVLFQQVLLS